MKNQKLPVSASPSSSLLNQNKTTQRGRRLSSMIYILALISMLTTSTVYGLDIIDTQSKTNQPSVTKQTMPDNLQYEINRSTIIADMKLI